MATRAEASRLARSLKLTLLDTGGRNFTVAVEATHGHHFTDGKEHERVFASWDNQKASDVWTDVVRFLRNESAMDPCDDQCEYWDAPFYCNRCDDGAAMSDTCDDCDERHCPACDACSDETEVSE